MSVIMQEELQNLVKSYIDDLRDEHIIKICLNNRYGLEIVDKIEDIDNQDRFKLTFRVQDKLYQILGIWSSFDEALNYDFKTLKEVKAKTKQVTYYE